MTSAAPGANYGSANRLKVDGSPVLRSYLRFGVEGLSQPVKRAMLWLYSYSSTGTGVSAHGVSDSAWGETTLTYSNAPAFGVVVGKSGAFQANGWVSIDVTPLVTGNGTVSLAVTTTSKSSKTFASREAIVESPTLLVETEEPPPPPSGGDPLIATAGDIACDPADGNYNGGLGTATACRQRYVSDLLVGGDLAAVLPLGDTQYEDGLLSKFQEVYDPTWGRVKQITRPAVGNHEYGVTGAAGYFDYFNGIGGFTGPAGDRGKGYYSFEVGSWHLVALNSNCSEVGGCGSGSAQEQWLRADLAAHPTSCTLAYWHHPRFSSSPAGSQSGLAPLWQALYEAGADIVLSGHAHHYERFGRQDASGAADPERGIRGFVVGTGGKSLYPFAAIAPNSAVRDGTSYGVLRMRLRTGGYDWQFAPAAGSSFTDSGSDVCQGSTPDSTPPSTPSGLTADGRAGDRVDLSWTASTDNEGVSGYRIYRDGSQVGTSPWATYSDLSLTPGTTYRYHVVAIDAAGNASEASNTATATTAVGTALTFAPTDDAYIRPDYPSSNYGVATTLQVDGSPIKNFLIKFSVSGVGTRTVTGAKLRLHAVDPSSRGGDFYRVGADWSQGTLTWSNAPAADSTPVASLGAVAAGNWYEVDVSSLVRGDGVVNLRVTTTSTDGADYVSKEGAAGLGPQLIVTTG